MAQMWQPNPQILQQLVLTLQQSTSPGENHKEIYKNFEVWENNPEYSLYLSFIFSHYDPNQPIIREQAGILLKNTVNKYFHTFTVEIQQYLTTIILQSIGDVDTNVRKFAAAILSIIVQVQKFEQCAEILGKLYQLLDDNTPINFIDGSLRTLQEITESCFLQTLADPQYEVFMKNLIPTLIKFLTHPNDPQIGRHSINIISIYSHLYPDIVATHFQQLLPNTIILVRDQDPKTRKCICSLYTSIRKNIPPESLTEVLKIISALMKDADSSVALAAGDFLWNILEISNPAFYEPLRNHLPELISILMSNIVFSLSERRQMEADEEESKKKVEVPKPHFVDKHKNDKNNMDDNYEGDDEYEIDDEDYGEYADEDPQSWTLRKCSACILDHISVIFKEQLVPIFLPQLAAIQVPNAPWYITESSILAIGAVAEGCIASLQATLPQMLGYVINNLSHENSFVRQIACWTVSRYSHWIIRQPHDQFFVPILAKILSLLLDESKSVQQAALSSFSGIMEDTHVNLIPYMEHIFRTYATALQTYQISNYYLLLDSIGILCDTHRNFLGNQNVKLMFAQTVMPNILEKLRITDNTDQLVLAICECLNYSLNSIRDVAKPFAEVIFSRCTTILDQYSSSGQEDSPEKNEFILASLDVIGALTDAIGKDIEPFVRNSNILGLLYVSSKSPDPSIRQIVFSIVGELVKTCFIHMERAIVPFTEEILKEVPNRYSPSMNNAVWAVGEFVVYGREILSGHLHRILEWLVVIINNARKKPLLENTAVALGKLCFYYPDIGATMLPNFVGMMTHNLIYLRESTEKDLSYSGLCFAITKNPAAVWNNNLINVFKAFACKENSNPELNNIFKQVIDYFKSNSSPEQWNEVLNQLGNKVDPLHQRFQIRDK